MQRLYSLNHSPIDFYFVPSPRDFVVEEIPLYAFSGSGEHLILKIRKKNLTTFELIETLSALLGIKSREIGYAGLKDKHAMTIQHVSLPVKFGAKVAQFRHENIKILESTLHDNKLRIGHLKGNRFFIRLKKITPMNSLKITQVLENLTRFGMPNYFGFQRFGNDGNNHEIGRKIAHRETKIANKKRKVFLLSAYQSRLFNEWLNERIKLNKILSDFSVNEILGIYPQLDSSLIRILQAFSHPFKLLRGEIMHHYPHGKIFELENLECECERFLARDVVPTGLLCGSRVKMAGQIAGIFETPFIDTELKEQGSRRFAWVFPEDVTYRYIEEEAQGELNFYLPKGSYATVFLEEIAHREIGEGGAYE